MTLKPWREIAIPHEDVLKGTFQQAEFAADLSRVHTGSAPPEYQDPVRFFQRTFITEGMRLLLVGVLQRLAGRGGEPVIQLQTAFGGGKTHTLLAVYHLACASEPPSRLAGVPPILDAAGVVELPRARVVVLDGVKLSPNQPQQHDGTRVHTLWGELAWQLGGAEGYALVQDADVSSTSPGKAALEALLARYAPCAILIDELVAYMRQFEEGKTLAGGTFDANLTFVQALTEAVKAVPTAVLLASLPESEKEAGGDRGAKALATLEHYFRRVQAIWKPVGTEEAFEIVRRRLFRDVTDRAAAQAVCQAYADFYATQRDDFPPEVQESRYRERLRRAYPIHPELFDRLYEDWSSLEGFQRTRGVLKLMAKVIHRLWQDDNRDWLIHPGSLPLYDADVSNELLNYLPAGWDPVIERDVDGPRASPWTIENLDPRLGAAGACRRVARTIFLGSAPHAVGLNTHHVARGIKTERVLLGAVQPGQAVSVFRDALARLRDQLHYLNFASDRYWFDTRPNLRREMEERKRRFDLDEDVLPLLRGHLQRLFSSSSLFGGVHVFAEASDVPDDWHLRLVVLAPASGYRKTTPEPAIAAARDILEKRGEAPRFKRNRLLFLACDADVESRLMDHARTYLAWRSLVQDYRDNRIVLDNLMARQAQESQQQAEATLARTLREAYRWLLVPWQEAQPGKSVSEVRWQPLALNTGAPHWCQEIERVLTEHELVIVRWAPIHLSQLLRLWFWKEENPDVAAAHVWHQMCQQLYLPRLKDDEVLRDTLAAGAESRDFFGLAQGKDGDRYLGFSFGKRFAPILDASLLLIDPAAAEAYEQRLAALRPSVGTTTAEPTYPEAPDASPCEKVADGAMESRGRRPDLLTAVGATQAKGSLPSAPATIKTRFYGKIDLDPVRAKAQFVDLADEVLQHFVTRPGMEVKLIVEIEAHAASGFDETLQRIVRENARVLGMNPAEFEED